MHFAQTLLTLCTAASAVLGAPTISPPSKLETRQTTFNGKSLTILPLGDSITVRIASTQRSGKSTTPVAIEKKTPNSQSRVESDQIKSKN
jgi:hypothetical protein